MEICEEDATESAPGRDTTAHSIASVQQIIAPLGHRLFYRLVRHSSE
jgi:hypothetical protein